MPVIRPKVAAPLVLFGCQFHDVPHTARVYRCHAMGAAAANGTAVMRSGATGGYNFWDPRLVNPAEIHSSGKWQARLLSLVVAGRPESGTAILLNNSLVTYVPQRIRFDDALSAAAAVEYLYTQLSPLNDEASLQYRAEILHDGPLPFVPLLGELDAWRFDQLDGLVVVAKHLITSTLGNLVLEAEGYVAVYPHPSALDAENTIRE